MPFPTRSAQKQQRELFTDHEAAAEPVEERSASAREELARQIAKSGRLKGVGIHLYGVSTGQTRISKALNLGVQRGDSDYAQLDIDDAIKAIVYLREELKSEQPVEEFLSWLAAGKVWGAGGGLRNVWLGVSVEDQAAADERITLLIETPAAVRFLSCEPLLGPLNIRTVLNLRNFERDYRDLVDQCGGEDKMPAHLRWNGKRPGSIDWVIVGGESGTGARPAEMAWVRAIVEQAQRAGVATFVKQLGTVLGGREHKNIDTFPPDLRVREFPKAH